MNIGSDLAAAQFAKPLYEPTKTVNMVPEAPKSDPFLNIYNDTTEVGRLVKEKYMQRISQKLKPVNATHRNSLKKIANVGEGSIYKFTKDVTDLLYSMMLDENTKLNAILKGQLQTLMEAGSGQYRRNTESNSKEQLGITGKLIESTLGTKTSPGMIKNTLDSFAASFAYALTMRQEAPSLEKALCSKLEDYNPEYFRTVVINACIKLIGFFDMLNYAFTAMRVKKGSPSRIAGLWSVMYSIGTGLENTSPPMESLTGPIFREKLENAIGKEQLEALLELGPKITKKLEALVRQIKVLQQIYDEPVIPTELEKSSAETVSRIQRLSMMSDSDRADEEFLESLGEVNDILLEVTTVASKLGIAYFLFTNGAIVALVKIFFTGALASGIDYGVASRFASPLATAIKSTVLGGRRRRRGTKKQKHGKKQKRRHTKKH